VPQKSSTQEASERALFDLSHDTMPIMEILYHGSKIPGLSRLEPRESGHGKKYVYAVTDPVFAAIFINRPGGSLVQAWGRDAKTGTPVLVERIENAIEKNYAGQEGSIYTVSGKDFERLQGMWDDERVHEGVVEVIREEKIADIKEYLVDQSCAGKLTGFYFKDRQKHPAGSDEALLKSALALIEKYGEQEIGKIKKYQPGIVDEVLKRMNRKS